MGAHQGLHKIVRIHPVDAWPLSTTYNKMKQPARKTNMHTNLLFHPLLQTRTPGATMGKCPSSVSNFLGCMDLQTGTLIIGVLSLVR
jgi:hypothetical protein